MSKDPPNGASRPREVIPIPSDSVPPRLPTPAESRAMSLVALMNDGDLSSQERVELRRMFKANPALLQTYVEQAVTHAMLEWRYAQTGDDAEFSGEPHDDTALQSFELHGQLSLRPVTSGGGIIAVPPPNQQLQLPEAPRPQHRRRGPWAAATVAGAAAVIAAAVLVWMQLHGDHRPALAVTTPVAPVEPTLPAVYVGFDTWSAVGGTLRKQLDPKMVAWTPQGLTYPNLKCSGGALQIDATNDQFLWLDLDADVVVSPNRTGPEGPHAGTDRGPDVAWPRGMPMGTPGTTLYISFLIRADQPVAHGFCGLGLFYGEGAVGNLFIGKARGVPGFSYDFGAVHKTLLDADPASISTRPVELDTSTHLIVTRIDFREGEDRFAIYFDPDPTKPEPKQANGSGVGKIALDRLRISAGRGADHQGGAVWYLDEIRLADRYAAVVPVAEVLSTQIKSQPAADSRDSR
jgi:hypothetical protein